MFYNLTEQQVNQIKTKFYPQEIIPGEFLKNVVVNDAGSDNPDNILQIALSLRDGSQGVFKVFNNETAKKYMKIKVFEILNNQMLEKVKSLFTIEEIEKTINFYGSLSFDLHASYDFVGDKKILESHQRLSDGSIELLYNVSFKLSRPKIDFFTLGVIFYFDKQQYISDQKVEQSFIDERILFNKLLTYNLFNNNNIVQIPSVPIQDLRLLKSTFKENGFLQNLLNIINSDNVYQNLTAANRQAAIDKLSSTNSPNINSVLEARNIIPFVNKKLVRAKPFKKPKSARKAFSSAFYSRNSNLFLGFTFSFDYEFIVLNNTPYPTIIASSDLKDELINKCKISSINIFRRAVENKGKNKYIPKPDTTTTIISSGEPIGNNTVTSVEDKNGLISEISLNTGVTSKIRTFTVNDKKIFIDTADLYQYGVEININDGITKFLTDHAKSLAVNISELKEYLEETNKIVTISKDGKNTIRGVYDPQKNAFTREFIEKFTLPRNKAKSFAQIVTDAAAVFESTLNLMGIFSSQFSSRLELQTSLTNTIVNLLNPKNTTAESISYFIKIYEKLVNQINRIVKNNFNNSYKVSYWFTNDYVDSKTPINIGYRFIDVQQYSGLGVLNTNLLNEKIFSDVNRYSTNQLTTPTNLNSKQYSYISPNAVFSKSKILNFTDLNNNPNAIPALSFAEMEIDIKNGNLSLTSIDKEKITNTTTDELKNKAKTIAIKSSILGKPLSLNIKNRLKGISDLEPIKQNLPVEKNDNTNETHLMLALAKQFDLTTGKYRPAVNNNNQNISRVELLKNPRIRENILEKFKSNTVEQTSARALPKALPSINTLFQFNASIKTVSRPLNSLPQINVATLQNRLPVLPRIPVGNLRIPVVPLLPAEELPHHLSALLDDKCSLLKNSDNYKKSLELNSKFQFLFNTIHSIEILEYANNMIDEEWSILTKEKIENLQKDNLYLFRIKSYRNPSLGIEGMEQINLPVYDQYFLFKKTDATRRPEIKKIKNLNDNRIIKANLFIEKIKRNLNLPKTVLNTAPIARTLQVPVIKTPFSPKTTIAPKTMASKKIKGGR